MLAPPPSPGGTPPPRDPPCAACAACRPALCTITFLSLLAGPHAGECRFLGYVDGELESDLAARSRVARIIRELRPDVVLGLNPHMTWGGQSLNMADHRNVGDVGVGPYSSPFSCFCTSFGEVKVDVDLGSAGPSFSSRSSFSLSLTSRWSTDRGFTEPRSKLER